MAPNNVSLVAGAAGFLGSHLVDRLLELGHLVFGLDNLSTGRLANLERAMGHPRFMFFQVDVSMAVWRPPVRPDYVWHLACPASPADCRRLGLETLLVNSLGTMNLLELAHQHRAAFLLASTCKSYSYPAPHPQPKDSRGGLGQVGELACCDEGRRFAEALTFEYRRRYRANACVVRLFNSYGPRMSADDRAVPGLARQALRGLPLTVRGEGRQTCSFVYVADGVDGMVRAMLRLGTDGGVFDLGGQEEFTVLELAGIIARFCGVELKVEKRPLPPDSSQRPGPDLTKGRAVLGWEPRTSLEEGLRETIAYFRSLLNSKGRPWRRQRVQAKGLALRKWRPEGPATGRKAASNARKSRKAIRERPRKRRRRLAPIDACMRQAPLFYLCGAFPASVARYPKTWGT